MQVDRRPNRGPYVAALVCLLTLCLTIPFYWQSRAERAKKREANDYEHLTTTLGGNFVRLDRYPIGGTRRPGDDAIDTLDELLFQLANRPGGITSSQPDVFMELLGTPEPGYGDLAEMPAGIVWQFTAAALHGAGQGIAEFEPGGSWCRSRRAAGAATVQPQRRAQPVRTFSLMLTDPNDRLAMLPAADRELRTRRWKHFRLPGARRPC